MRPGSEIWHCPRLACTRLSPISFCLYGSSRRGRERAGRERIKWISLLFPQFLHYSLFDILILQSHHLSVRGKAGKEEERE